MMTKKKILIGSVFAALLMVSMPLVSSLQLTPVTTITTTTSVQQPAIVTPSDISTAEAINSLQIIKARSSNPEVKYDCQQAISYFSGGIVRKTICNLIGGILNTYFTNTNWVLLEMVVNDLLNYGHLTNSTKDALRQAGLWEVGLLLVWFIIDCKDAIGQPTASSASISSQLIAQFEQSQSSTSVCSLCAASN